MVGIDPKSPAANGQRPALTLIAGLLAGVASLLVGERILDAYRGDLVPKIEAHPSPGSMQRLRDARVSSATLTYRAMGGFLGLAMGLAGGMARRSTFAAGTAAIVGVVFGAVVVGLVSRLLVSRFFETHDPQSGDLVLPLLTHGAIWSAAGAIGGLAFGLGLGGRGRWKAALVGGLVGAAAATIIYELVGALVFATAKTDLPVSASIATRSLAHLLIAILSATGVVLALHRSPKRADPSSVAA
jgi:hypothetical protein